MWIVHHQVLRQLPSVGLDEGVPFAEPFLPLRVLVPLRVLRPLLRPRAQGIRELLQALHVDGLASLAALPQAGLYPQDKPATVLPGAVGVTIEPLLGVAAIDTTREANAAPSAGGVTGKEPRHTCWLSSDTGRSGEYAAEVGRGRVALDDPLEEILEVLLGVDGDWNEEERVGVLPAEVVQDLGRGLNEGRVLEQFGVDVIAIHVHLQVAGPVFLHQLVDQREHALAVLAALAALQQVGHVSALLGLVEFEEERCLFGQHFLLLLDLLPVQIESAIVAAEAEVGRRCLLVGVRWLPRETLVAQTEARDEADKVAGPPVDGSKCPLPLLIGNGAIQAAEAEVEEGRPPLRVVAALASGEELERQCLQNLAA
mmetsp:Transcript_84478/g.262293  ORF Transcript_84478/g.262293 Transcript_84478/m.262293 type:complete len:370 (-) Transcript_84478:199-1308(-)